MVLAVAPNANPRHIASLCAGTQAWHLLTRHLGNANAGNQLQRPHPQGWHLRMGECVTRGELGLSDTHGGRGGEATAIATQSAQSSGRGGVWGRMLDKRGPPSAGSLLDCASAQTTRAQLHGTHKAAIKC